MHGEEKLKELSLWGSVSLSLSYPLLSIISFEPLLFLFSNDKEFNINEIHDQYSVKT